MNRNEIMLHIKALDPRASLEFSEWTGQWYVSASVEIGDGGCLVGICEHRPTPDLALSAFLDAARGLDLDHYLVSRHYGERRHWRWNGAAFAEVTRPTTPA